MNRCHQSTIKVATDSKIQLIDLTAPIGREVAASNIVAGYAIVFSPHTTSGIIVNENEPGLVKDFAKALEDFIPRTAHYLHDRIDSNATAHLAGGFIGNHVNLIIAAGRIKLGRWQSVFFVELDGPRAREVYLQVYGDTD